MLLVWCWFAQQKTIFLVLNQLLVCRSSYILVLVSPICFVSNLSLLFVIVIGPVTYFRSDNGVCRVDKDTQSGRSRPTSTFHANGGGNSVSDWSSSDSLLQTRQHRGTMVAPFKHWFYREKVTKRLSVFICIRFIYFAPIVTEGIYINWFHCAVVLPV